MLDSMDGRKRLRNRRRRMRNTRILLIFSCLFLAGFLCGCLFMGILGWVKGSKPVTSENREMDKVAAAPQESLPVEIDKIGLVVVDAGHGGWDPGCMEADTWESQINLQMALILQGKLEEREIEVLMTRTDDSGITLDDRVDLANSAEADAYVSIHQNSYDSSSVSGLEVFYNPNKEIGGQESEELAQKLQDALSEEASIKNRGLKENKGLQVLRTTDMAAVLVEVGYLTSPSELEKLLSEDYQNLVMERIAQGVEDYLRSGETGK